MQGPVTPGSGAGQVLIRSQCQIQRCELPSGLWLALELPLHPTPVVAHASLYVNRIENVMYGPILLAAAGQESVCFLLHHKQVGATQDGI